MSAYERFVFCMPEERLHLFYTFGKGVCFGIIFQFYFYFILLNINSVFLVHTIFFKKKSARTDNIEIISILMYANSNLNPPLTYCCKYSRENRLPLDEESERRCEHQSPRLHIIRCHDQSTEKKGWGKCISQLIYIS